MTAKVPNGVGVVETHTLTLSLPEGGFRLEEGGVLPRVDASGKTDSVTLLNLSMGDTGAFEVRIRNPRGQKVVYETPKGTVPGVKTTYDAAKDELRVTLPDLVGWHIGTIFLD